MVKKVIEISGNHGFDIGVVTFVVGCNLEKQTHALRPEIEYAFDYTPCAHEYIVKSLKFIKAVYSKAHVRLIQID